MRSLRVGVTLLALRLATFPALAQHGSSVTTGAPSSVSSSAAATNVQPGTTSALEAPHVHAFWVRTNDLLFSGVAISRGLDYASTRNMQARGRKEILLPQEVVNNSAAFASIEAAGAATSVGISYIFHRTGHHTLERWMSIGHIGVAGFGAVRNYCLVSKHPH